jgi:hypothetical protein
MPFGIILWFVPYTLLAIGLGFGAGTSPSSALRNMALAAPIPFTLLMLAEGILVNLPAESFSIFIKEICDQSIVIGIFSLVFGYICVGIAFGIFKLLQGKNLIAEETAPPIPKLNRSIPRPDSAGCPCSRNTSCRDFCHCVQCATPSSSRTQGNSATCLTDGRCDSEAVPPIFATAS